MLKALRPKMIANQGGFTLIELLVVVLMVGVLAAVGVPLYLGYVRDSRLAEAKAIAGSALTAAQACAQVFPGAEAANCTFDKTAQKIGVATDTGLTGDGKWKVAVTTVTLSTATNKFGGGPVTVGGQVAPVDSMAAGVFIDAAGITQMHCNTAASTVAVGDSTC